MHDVLVVGGLGGRHLDHVAAPRVADVAHVGVAAAVGGGLGAESRGRVVAVTGGGGPVGGAGAAGGAGAGAGGGGGDGDRCRGRDVDLATGVALDLGGGRLAEGAGESSCQQQEGGGEVHLSCYFKRVYVERVCVSRRASVYNDSVNVRNGCRTPIERVRRSLGM